MIMKGSNNLVEHNPFAWLENYCHKKQPTLEIDLTNKTLEEAWESACSHLATDQFSLADQIAHEFDLHLAKLESTLNDKCLHYIPHSVATRYHVFPINHSDDQIIVATANPLDSEMLSMLRFLTALHVEPQVAPPHIVQQWINAYYEKPLDANEVKIKLRQKGGRDKIDSRRTNDSAVIEIVSDMLLEAFALNASDIHIEPFKEGGVIRYRIDGMLRIVTELPAAVLTPIIQRIKAISSLNLANKMIPQDGSVSLVMKNQPVDLRVSTIPVKSGEKAVIRLLSQSSVKNIEHIGLPQREKEKFQQILKNSSGIFIITGPTGSGKSTTLYSALKELNTPERCLVTVEDPIEYEIDGIAQISVNRAQDVTFNKCLRSILRQDPDIILVGEVRDEETADITFRAAITGHFVMTTLHTNDAISTIPRLNGLGVPNAIIADSLRGVASQRLVRKLCPHCKTTTAPDNDPNSKRFFEIYSKSSLYFPTGCDNCNQSGYSGRIPLFEIISIDTELADAIRSNASTTELRQFARKRGNRSISTIACEAIQNGDTSVEEIHRVLGEQFWEELDLVV